MKTNLLKTFQSFANSRKSIPILECVKVENNTATITDGETWVQFYTNHPDGIYKLINGELFKQGYDPEDFPVLELTKVGDVSIKASTIIEYAPCVSGDELRPVMNGICIDGTTVVASDCHVLRLNDYAAYSPHPSDFKAIFQPTKPLLSRCRVNPDEEIIIHTGYNTRAENSTEPRYIQFHFSDCIITQRLVEGVYPNYRGVIPNYSNLNLNCFAISATTCSEMAKTSKAFDRPLITIDPRKSTIENLDLDLLKEWDTIQCERQYRAPDGILMPMIIESTDTISSVGISAERLLRMGTNHKGYFILGFSDNTRALAVWLEKSYNYDEWTLTNQSTATEQQPCTPVPLPEPEPEVTEHEPEPEQAPQVPDEPFEEAPALPTETETPREPEEHQTPEQQPTPEPETIHIVEYSPKAIAVFGSTKQFRDEFLKIWGRWVPLTDPTTGIKKTGWIFSKKREAQVREIIKAA